MWAIATYRNIAAVLHVINGIAVLAQYPNLSHVTSLAIGGLDSKDCHNGLTVDR